MARGRISGEVRITGVINDDEFAAAGEASGDPDTGIFQVRLDYEHVPRGWHPHMYTDVKVSLLFLKEEDGGQNFISLAGGRYTSAGTIDLGDGNVLRNNTSIQMLNERTFKAVYVMYGTAQLGELGELEHFEETMLPMGPGRVAALALARWKRPQGEPVDAIFSTRYHFASERGLNAVQVRRIHAEPKFDGRVFECSYKGFVRALPAMIESGGPYIGHLIA